MSYGAGAALQTAIFGLLATAPELAGVGILDAIPPGGGGGTFVLIGPEEVVDLSDSSGGGTEHRFSVSVISDAAGFLAAKSVSGAVSERLIAATPPLSCGRVVSIRFVKAVARRLNNGAVRRVDLTFRARIEL